MVKAAVVQMDIALGQPDLNKRKILDYAAKTEADLVVFPECANSGYAFNSQEEALPCAESISGPFVESLAVLAREKSRHLAVGILEKDGPELRNTALLVTPQGEIHLYRKSHLPSLGVDRFVIPGKELPLFSTGLGNIGLLICYDWRFPEVARCLSLQGADLLIGLSNWPPGAMVIPTILLPARAAENHVWIVSASRIGLEGGSEFIGRSMIIGPDGNTAASVEGNGEEIIRHDLDLSLSRQKHRARQPGQYEIDLFQDRCPALYGTIRLECKRD